MNRLVMTAAGLRHDPTGKKDGRGAYLCSDNCCWQRAIDSNLLAKALRKSLQVEDRQLLRTLATELTDADPK